MAPAVTMKSPKVLLASYRVHLPAPDSEFAENSGSAGACGVLMGRVQLQTSGPNCSASTKRDSKIAAVAVRGATRLLHHWGVLKLNSISANFEP
jgi:hypothetical protein